jgi:hypothetical protein
MIRTFLSRGVRFQTAARFPCYDKLGRIAGGRAMAIVPGIVAGLVFAALLQPGRIAAQVLTIDTSGKVAPTANGPVDRRFQQIEPTHVDLPKAELDTKARYELIRVMQSEQGFAMRPLPRGHKGITLVANGKLEPAGEAYLNLAVSEGLCAKPGDRVVVTDVKIEKDKIVFELNGGPDLRHRLLRHVEIGAGGSGDTTPMVQGDDSEPVGARLTLDFKEHVPELIGEQVKALLAPLISFDVKTPVQAFTDTLPPQLKKAILDHQVLVGMSTDMVLFAKGQPQSKSREMDGQEPFEEWIYGKPPEDVDFVRINGNRVIRVEIAKAGEPLEIFTKDVVDGMMRTDGTPVVVATTNTHTIREGDVERDPNKEAPDAPPSLRNPGEKPEGQNPQNTREMKPVQFPKPRPDDQPGANPDDQPPAASPAATSQPEPAPQSNTKSQPAGTNQAAPATNGSQPAPSAAPGASQSSPPAGSN